MREDLLYVECLFSIKIHDNTFFEYRCTMLLRLERNQCCYFGKISFSISYDYPRNVRQQKQFFLGILVEYQPEFVTTLDKDIIADSKPAAGHIYGAGTLMFESYC